jgi:hypothetical protein
MSIEEHDKKMSHCPMLGHEVPFSYCRKGAVGQPCRKIFDCWFQSFDIEQFIREHYTEDQIHAFLSPPKPKMATLLELIRNAEGDVKQSNNVIDPKR